ncbi:MAG: 4-hydroxy-tetrahydrodipicolinate reductase [Bacteroidales bacterium]|nr:4-hydroxy-tetrahydrodipicolinate reductase [Bacteroidales bacterium]
MDNNLKIVISGYGKMGRMVEAVLLERGIECVAATEDIQAIDTEAARHCVCIDFTTPQAIRDNYKFLADNFKAVVIGTTGWDDIHDEILDYFRQRGTTLVYSSNFSIGVNLLFAAVDFITKKMARTGGYSPYVLEMHHCHKLDAPSGTAKTLARIVEDNTGLKPDVSAVRCGEIPGIHTAGFEGKCDRIKLYHEAFSRMGFAEGAVDAAIKANALKGVFDFKEIIFVD